MKSTRALFGNRTRNECLKNVKHIEALHTATILIPNRLDEATLQIKNWIEEYASTVGQPLIVTLGGQWDKGQIFGSRTRAHSQKLNIRPRIMPSAFLAIRSTTNISTRGKPELRQKRIFKTAWLRLTA